MGLSAGRVAWPGACACASVLVTVAAARAATLTEVQNFGSNPGGLRMFIALPDDLAPGAPLVVALHGCGQQAADYASAGWDALADAHGFAVVYPQQTPINNYYRCFTWWGDELSRGADENQSIQQMVEHAIQNHGVDPARVFVTGLSAGGAVAVNLLALWPDVFAAGGIVAGIPFGCAPSLSDTNGCIDPGADRSASAWGQRVRDAHLGVSGGYPRLSLWQGTADSVVSSSNLRELTEQWLDVHGLSSAPAVDESAGVVRHQVYRAGGGPDLVEVFTLQGIDHGTPVDPDQGCGVAGAYFLDLDLCSSQRMAAFFGIVALDGGAGDAGGSSDGGTADRAPGVDASSQDLPTIVDAGAGHDAVAPVDAQVADRAMTTVDAGQDDRGQRPVPPAACGCRASDRAPGAAWIVFAAAALARGACRRRSLTPCA